MVSVMDDWVQFAFYRPQADRVFLAGEFNEWHASELPMAKTSDGRWVAKIRLPAGDFKFRYCADGEWFADYAAFGVAPGPFGLDSVVRVAAKPIRLATTERATETAAA